MPILPAEPDLYPDHLLDEGSPVETPVRWWVLQTLARREKELMRRLRTLDIGHYGPLIKRKTRSPQGRVRTSYAPLFTGYLFLCGDEPQRYRAMTTNCVSRCLEVGDPGQLVRELRQIHRLIASGAPLTPESRLVPGGRVRIRNGALAGIEGTVVRRQGADRLVVAVTFLQQGASLQLDEFQVEPLEG